MGVFGLSLAIGPVSVINSVRSKRDISDEEKEWAAEDAKIKGEAERAVEILNDYSFKIFLPCWRSGTGWILDYEIPKGDTYPTKWYIATNAHVANHFVFPEDTYGQNLPIEKIGKNSQALIDTAGLWKPKLDSWELCDSKGVVSYFDFGLSQQKTGEGLKSNYGLMASDHVKSAKLFYSAVDFLKPDPSKDIPKDNYKDFAVIEVEFWSPEKAKIVTNNFYEKYGKDSPQKTPLDVFAFPLAEERNKPKTEYSKQRLYSLGYAYKEGKPFQYTFSFDQDLVMASELARNVNGLSDGDGFTNAQRVDRENPTQMTDWYGKHLHRVGDFYLVDNFEMSGGASGGLVVDANGEVWGLRSMGNKVAKRTLVVPLRSWEIKDGPTKTPAYDLIWGGIEGQETSYRQQVEKYILENNRETWLSRRAKWKYGKGINRNYQVLRPWMRGQPYKVGEEISNFIKKRRR